MKRLLVPILFAALCAGCGTALKPEFAHDSRGSWNGEVTGTGGIVYLPDWCDVNGKASCYTIALEDGNVYPLIFEPVVPTKVFPGQYDIIGRFIAIGDERFHRAISVRQWSRVK